MHSSTENILKDLWHNYALDKYNMIESEQGKELISLIVKNEEELRTELSPTQIRLLEELTDNINSLNMLSLEKAFASGVRFATSYLAEALDDKR